jgi:hypothetical protein
MTVRKAAVYLRVDRNIPVAAIETTVTYGDPNTERLTKDNLPAEFHVFSEIARIRIAQAINRANRNASENRPGKSVAIIGESMEVRAEVTVEQ